MSVKLALSVLACAACLFGGPRAPGGNSLSVVWTFDRTDSIGGHPTLKLGDPVVIATPDGEAVYFDGIDDGLIVQANPVGDAAAFTIETVFKPDSSYPNNREQRFIHIQNPVNENRRILMELRLIPNQQWFLDTFIKSDSSSLALFAKDFPHPLGSWQHAALVYQNGTMRHYLNGREEMSGLVQYLPIEGGATSIGVRMNRLFWFKGALRMLKITRQALPPAEFSIGPMH